VSFLLRNHYRLNSSKVYSPSFPLVGLIIFFICFIILFLISACATTRCGSIGNPDKGSLRCGERLTKGYGYRVAESDYAWATKETITLIQYAASATLIMFSDAPDLLIGHLSSKNGGKLLGHISHQSGRDVDVGFYHKDGKYHRTFFNAEDETLDVLKTWYFLETLLLTNRVKLMLLDWDVQRLFYQYLYPVYPKNKLDEWLQYPRPPEVRVGIIRHSPSHKDHVHIRFICPENDRECVD